MSDVKIKVGVTGASEAAKSIADLRKAATGAGSDIAAMQAKADAGMGGAAKAAKSLTDESGKASEGIEKLGHGLRGMGPVAASMHEAIRFLASPLGILILGLTEFAKVVGEGAQKADEYKKVMAEGGQKLEDFEKKLTDVDRAQMRMGEQMTGSFHNVKEALVELFAMPWEPYIDRSVAALARLESGDKSLQAASEELGNAQTAAAEQALKAYAAEAGKGQELFKTYLDAVEKSRKALAEWREEQVRSKIASGAVTPEEGAKQIAAIKSENKEETYNLDLQKWKATKDASREKYLADTSIARRTVSEYEQQEGATTENARTLEGNETAVKEMRGRREATAELMKQTGPNKQMQDALALWDLKINGAVAEIKEQQAALEEAMKILAANKPKADEARRTLEKAQKDRPLQMASEDEELQTLQVSHQTETTREANAASRVGLEAKEKAQEAQLKAEEKHLTEAKEGKAPEQIEALHAAASAQRAGGGQLAQAIQALANAMDKDDAHPASLIHALTQKVEALAKSNEQLKEQIKQLPTGGN